MKFKKVITVLILVLVLSMWSTVSAAPEAIDLTPVADDIAVYNDSALNIETPLASGGSADPGGYCISQYVTFLKFNLTPATIPAGSTISGATLTLRSTGFLNGSTTITLRLYGSTNDSWIEGAGQIGWASQPNTDFDLNTEYSGPIVPAGNDVVFNTSPELVSFLNNELNGDRIVTLVIKTIACNFPASRQYMASKETTGSDGIPARLTITGTKPNSVALSIFTTDTPAPTWPLYAGLGALVLIAVARVAWSRRSASAR